MQKWGWPAYTWTNCTLLASRFAQTRSHSGISSKWDTKQRNYSLTKPIWWYLAPVNFEFWTGMQISGKISSYSVSRFPWAVYFGTSADRLCLIIFLWQSSHRRHHSANMQWSNIFLPLLAGKSITKKVVRDLHAPAFKRRLAKIQLLLQS